MCFKQGVVRSLLHSLQQQSLKVNFLDFLCHLCFNINTVQGLNALPRVRGHNS